MLCILNEISNSYKLEFIGRSRILERRLDLTSIEFDDRRRIKIIVVGLILGNIARILDIKEFIRSNIGSMLTCEDVANYSNMTLRHLNRLTNKCLGIPVSKLIAQYKIERIPLLIVNDQKTFVGQKDMAQVLDIISTVR